MSKASLIATGLALAVPACNIESSHTEADTPQAFDARPVERAGVVVPPITGGTLLVTRDGAFAIASDPDRSLIHVVDLAAGEESATIPVDPGSAPFRAVEDDAGHVHVTLRDSGRIATLDPARGELLATTPVCGAPRGIASAQGALHVACSDGELVRLDPTTREVTRRTTIAPDLRDVLVTDDRLLVSRFRSAELYEIADDGSAHLVAQPQSLRIGASDRAPGTAWRTLALPRGGWLMLHQLANKDPLPGGGDDDSGDEASPGDGYGGRADDPCDGATNVSLTADLSGQQRSAGGIGPIALAVDVAIAPDGASLVIASPSEHELQERASMSLARLSLDDFSDGPSGDCRTPVTIGVADDFVAVAFTPDGDLLALTRNEPRLYRLRDEVAPVTIELAGDSVRDTGHDLFHLDAGEGLACASCHPEGGDDGRVWSFMGVGPRRTPALDVGLRGTEPFHWSGDLPDMPALVDEVRHRRMGGAVQSDERTAALQDWLFALPPVRPMRDDDDDAELGRALFAELGCARCHSGERFTSNAFEDLGDGPLQIPTLHGVALRAPYMHDGRSPDLAAAVRDMLTATPGARTPDDDEIAAVVAYLETL